MKILPRNGRGLGHVTLLKNLEPVYIFGTLNIETSYSVQHVLAIAWQITPKVGVVRSRDLILQYNVKVANKTANINVKKLVSLKHGVRAISFPIVSSNDAGVQAVNMGITWPRFVRAASAFCLMSSQKWSVLFLFASSPLQVTPCFKLTTFYIDYFGSMLTLARCCWALLLIFAVFDVSFRRYKLQIN